jgi:hypothetical protein
MHGTDFLTDLDVADSTKVAEARSLVIAIADGVQAMPSPPTAERGNRLLVFTGTAIPELLADGDGELARGVVRVRLGFPLKGVIHYVGSASWAALASLHSGNQDCTWAADSVKVVSDPTDAATLGNDPGLPGDELYLLIDAAMRGTDGTVLSRLSYQANVLVLDTEPDVASLLVRRAGSSDPFSPDISLETGDEWEYLVTLTAPLNIDADVVILSSNRPDLASVSFELLTFARGEVQKLGRGGGTGPSENDTATISAARARSGSAKTAGIFVQRIPRRPRGKRGNA